MQAFSVSSKYISNLIAGLNLTATAISASAPNPDVAVEKEIQSVLPTAIEEELVQINQPKTLAKHL